MTQLRNQASREQKGGSEKSHRGKVGKPANTLQPDQFPLNCGRVAIEDVTPTVEGGRFAAKATVGMPLQVFASIFLDGHDLLTAQLVVRQKVQRAAGSEPLQVERQMMQVQEDRFGCTVTLQRPGTWEFAIMAAPDPYATLARDLQRMQEASQPVAAELREAGALIETVLPSWPAESPEHKTLSTLVSLIRHPAGIQQAYQLALDARVLAAMRPRLYPNARTAAGEPLSTISPWFPVYVDEERAAFSSWYELFPRSQAASSASLGSDGRRVDTTGGTTAAFRKVIERLPAIAAMGFDTLYLPPIHPIGLTARKGRNNSVLAGPDDPGSPWAIGNSLGGHTAIEPSLGNFADFAALVESAHSHGLELALDFAAQCSPDHPWVTEHPDWFKHRVDGSIRHAENPPKKYEDIVPLNFECADRASLYSALLEVVLFWHSHGVRTFRVDNPHTKPFAFWEWLIGEVHQVDPGVIFLAEAFTRKAVMMRLAKAGFSQSYTYFTWKVSRGELALYLEELAHGPESTWFRPNFWVNTPDILHAVLQEGGPPAFRMRALLAALSCPSWGMYSGYELCESKALAPGSEEYEDSEKYQLRPRDWDAPDSIAPFIARLNAIRKNHRSAVSHLPGLQLLRSDNDQILAFARVDPESHDTLLVVVNLDPAHAQESTIWVEASVLPPGCAPGFIVDDELDGNSYQWKAEGNYVRLDPNVQPGHVFSVKAP